MPILKELLYPTFVFQIMQMKFMHTMHTGHRMYIVVAFYNYV